MASNLRQMTTTATIQVADLRTRGFSDTEARQIVATAYAKTLKGQFPSEAVIEFVYAIYPEGRS